MLLAAAAGRAFKRDRAQMRLEDRMEPRHPLSVGPVLLKLLVQMVVTSFLVRLADCHGTLASRAFLLARQRPQAYLDVKFEAPACWVLVLRTWAAMGPDDVFVFQVFPQLRI